MRITSYLTLERTIVGGFAEQSVPGGRFFEGCAYVPRGTYSYLPTYLLLRYIGIVGRYLLYD